MTEEANIFAEFEAEPKSRLDSNQDLGGNGGAANAEDFPSQVDSPRPLFNQRKPLYELKSESPRHRAIIMMAAAGMGNKEIASALGMSAQHVMYVKKQPWAVEQILKEIENAGREPVLQLLKVTAMEAAQTLISVMQNTDNLEIKRKASNDVLDRVFGKATSKIEVSNKAPSEFTDAELAAIAAQGKKN